MDVDHIQIVVQARTLKCFSSFPRACDEYIRQCIKCTLPALLLQLPNLPDLLKTYWISLLRFSTVNTRRYHSNEALHRPPNLALCGKPRPDSTRVKTSPPTASDECHERRTDAADEYGPHGLYSCMSHALFV